MATTTLPQELIMWGINPFMPQLGIYAGGYQGIFYPNPTTLVLQTIRDSFEPLNFRDAEASNYTPNAYTGLGKGNPGIDYRNPGHLLGLMDTFFRTAYALNIIKGLRTSEDLRSPIINMDFQMRVFEGYKQVIRNDNNFYPDSVEVPTDYLDEFLNKIKTVLERPFNPEDRQEGISLIIEDEIIGNDAIHLVTAEEIDLDGLFSNIHTDTYFDIHSQFKDFLSQLKTEAEAFESLVIIPLDVYPVITLDTGSRRVPSINGSVVDSVPSNGAVKGEYINKCTTLSIAKALELINQDGEFHLGPLEPTLDYRTFTELNAVVNILPIQINGGRFSEVSKAGSAGSFASWFNYFICDVNLNITNLGDPKTIDINGDVLFEFTPIGQALLDADLPTSPLNTDDGSFNVNTAASRVLIYEMRSQNKFGWDKNWFDLEEHNQIKNGIQFINHEQVERRDFDINPPPGDSFSVLVLDPPPNETFAFNETLDLVTGQNNLVLRILVQSSWGGFYSRSTEPELLPMRIRNTTEVNIDDITFTLNIGDILSETFTLGGKIPQALTPPD